MTLALRMFLGRKTPSLDYWEMSSRVELQTALISAAPTALSMLHVPVRLVLCILQHWNSGRIDPIW